MIFRDEYDKRKKIVEDALPSYILKYNAKEYELLYQAMEYSLMAGGKRFRPVIHLETIRILGGDVETYLDSACALECIHTYSLIHDDLPAMDNDDYRRGKLTNHKVYGENVAILAGDGLLNTAYEILLQKILLAPSVQNIKGAELIAKSAGANGMIAGQLMDIQSEGRAIDIETLSVLHKNKTGALIEASILSAALMMNVSADELDSLSSYASKLGLAFQISDDILDHIGTFEELGKPIGSDLENNKSTFVSHYGLENSKKILLDTVNGAIDSISSFKDNLFFVELAKYLTTRKS